MANVTPGNAVSPFLLVIDAGSSSVRATVFDGQAQAVAGWDVKIDHDLPMQADGGVEDDADAVVERVAIAIDTVLERVGAALPRIEAVGIAAYAATVVGVDEQGRPVTPLYLYADTRPARDVAELRAALDEAAIHDRTGCRLHTSYVPARLVWLRRTEPERYARVRRWVSLPEYLYFRLFGRWQVSPSIASWSGLLDRRTLDWDGEWLRYLEIPVDALSPVNGSPLRGPAFAFAKRWPALADAAWYPAFADGAASNAGSGCLTPSSVALNLGTSAALRVALPGADPVLPSALWCYRLDERRALLGGALSEGGSVFAWVRNLLGSTTPGLSRDILHAEPDGHGLTVLPTFAGERSPGWNAYLRGVIVGLRLDTSPEDIVQALLEAVAYRLALVHRALETVAPARHIVAGGGATQHLPEWLQIIADATGRPVERLAEPEATSRGVAVLLLEQMGVPADSLSPRAAQVFVPRPRHQAVYQAAIARQARLYDAVSPFFTAEG